MPGKWDRFPFRLAKAGWNLAKSGPLRVAIGAKRQADTAPATAGIREKKGGYISYTQRFILNEAHQTNRIKIHRKQQGKSGRNWTIPLLPHRWIQLIELALRSAKPVL